MKIPNTNRHFYLGSDPDAQFKKKETDPESVSGKVMKYLTNSSDGPKRLVPGVYVGGGKVEEKSWRKMQEELTQQKYYHRSFSWETPSLMELMLIYPKKT